MLVHGRGEAYLKAHPDSFCNGFRTNLDAIRECWELKQNFMYTYLAPCAALTVDVCGRGIRKECTWCGTPGTGECVESSNKQSTASEPCAAVSTTEPLSMSSVEAITTQAAASAAAAAAAAAAATATATATVAAAAAGVPSSEARCWCVGGGGGARCRDDEIAACVGERYDMLLPLELIDEARALLVLDHGFAVPDVMCTELSQHEHAAAAPGHLALASANTPPPRPDASAFFTAAERQELLDNNQIDVLLHRYAVAAIEARIKARHTATSFWTGPHDVPCSTHHARTCRPMLSFFPSFLSLHADRMLAGPCNPMAFPIPVFRRTETASTRRCRWSQAGWPRPNAGARPRCPRG